MNKEYEYFGFKISQVAYNSFVCTIDDCGETIELRAEWLDDIKEKIRNYLRKKERNEVIERLCEDFDMTRKAAEFVINMTASFHSCENAAVRRISDYLNANNYC